MRSAGADVNSIAGRCRKRERRAAEAVATAAKQEPPDAQRRCDVRVVEFMKMAINGERVDLVPFWDDAARARSDSSSSSRVYWFARFLIFATLARVYHSKDNTSCQSVRDFSALQLILNDFDTA